MYIKDGGLLHDSVTPDFAFRQNFISRSRALHVICSRLFKAKFKANKNRRLSASAGAHFRFTEMSLLLVSDKFIGVLSGFVWVLILVVVSHAVWSVINNHLGNYGPSFDEALPGVINLWSCGEIMCFIKYYLIIDRRGSIW